MSTISEASSELTGRLDRSPARHREFEPGQIMGAALQAGVAAAIVNGVLFAVASGFGVPFVGKFFPAAEAFPLKVSMAVLTSSILGVVAGVVLVVLNALFTRPVPAFIRLSAGLLVASFAGPVALPDATIGTKIALLMMHVAGAIAIVSMLLLRSSDPDRPATKIQSSSSGEVKSHPLSGYSAGALKEAA